MSVIAFLGGLTHPLLLYVCFREPRAIKVLAALPLLGIELSSSKWCRLSCEGAEIKLEIVPLWFLELVQL